MVNPNLFDGLFLLRIFRLVMLWYSYITISSDFETKINLPKLAHFAVMVSRLYSEKEAAIRDQCIEEPILYIKMQIALFKLEQDVQLTEHCYSL
jgi:26S proteasome regulatory subunit N9